MLEILKRLISMFSGGTWSSVIKILGFVSVRLLGFWIDRLISKQKKERKENELQENLDAAQSISAAVSREVTSSLHLADQYLTNAERENLRTLRERFRPLIKAPVKAKVNEPFVVVTANIEPGTEIWADRKWVIGKVNASNQTQVVLTSPGERTIDIYSGDNWVSSQIIIES